MAKSNDKLEVSSSCSFQLSFKNSVQNLYLMKRIVSFDLVLYGIAWIYMGCQWELTQVFTLHTYMRLRQNTKFIMNK
tara:strand:+ start:251 stop:481 length:231 start_codon:yes stop_codon:yes gene_type:complete